MLLTSGLMSEGKLTKIGDYINMNKETKLAELKHKIDNINKNIKNLEESDLEPFEKYIKYIKLLKVRDRLKKVISEV